MARPRIWQPFETVKWASTHQFTEAGDIRDRHRNVLPIGAGPDYDVSLRLYDTARKITLPRRDILALEFFGEPPEYRCCICDKILPTDVLHLNKDQRDFRRDNLKYGSTFTGRAHEINCLTWAMVCNEVPPRRHTRLFSGIPWQVNSMPRKSAAEAPHPDHDERDWGPTDESIPLLGINPQRG